MENKNTEDNENEESLEEDNKENKPKKFERLEKFQMDRVKGRIIVFNAEESEFAKHLNLTKKGDYAQKAK